MSILFIALNNTIMIVTNKAKLMMVVIKVRMVIYHNYTLETIKNIPLYVFCIRRPQNNV